MPKIQFVVGCDYSLWPPPKPSSCFSPRTIRHWSSSLWNTLAWWSLGQLPQSSDSLDKSSMEMGLLLGVHILFMKNHPGITWWVVNDCGASLHASDLGQHHQTFLYGRFALTKKNHRDRRWHNRGEKGTLNNQRCLVSAMSCKKTFPPFYIFTGQAPISHL